MDDIKGFIVDLVGVVVFIVIFGILWWLL